MVKFCWPAKMCPSRSWSRLRNVGQEEPAVLPTGDRCADEKDANRRPGCPWQRQRRALVPPPEKGGPSPSRNTARAKDGPTLVQGLCPMGNLALQVPARLSTPGKMSMSKINHVTATTTGTLRKAFTEKNDAAICPKTRRVKEQFPKCSRKNKDAFQRQKDWDSYSTQ